MERVNTRFANNCDRTIKRPTTTTTITLVQLSQIAFASIPWVLLCTVKSVHSLYRCVYALNRPKKIVFHWLCHFSIISVLFLQSCCLLSNRSGVARSELISFFLRGHHKQLYIHIKSIYSNMFDVRWSLNVMNAMRNETFRRFFFHYIHFTQKEYRYWVVFFRLKYICIYTPNHTSHAKRTKMKRVKKKLREKKIRRKSSHVKSSELELNWKRAHWRWCEQSRFGRSK